MAIPLIGHDWPRICLGLAEYAHRDFVQCQKMVPVLGIFYSVAEIAMAVSEFVLGIVFLFFAEDGDAAAAAGWLLLHSFKVAGLSVLNIATGGLMWPICALCLRLYHGNWNDALS